MGSSKEGARMKEIIRLSMVLAIVGCLAGLALSSVYSLTRQQILLQEQQAIFSAQKALFPEAEEFKPLSIEAKAMGSVWIDSAYEAMDSDKNVKGLLVNARTPGYGGMIVFVVGFDLEKQLRGVQVTSQSETPGLGANVSKKSFLDQFINKSINDPFVLKNDVKAITASTITTKALVQGIQGSIEWLQSYDKGGSS
jgi:Na+-translocating ferredoxin:NAD+ oxidoreductase subunit G